MVKSNVRFDRSKFEAAILYLISRAPKQTIEGKKKLAKLLYFTDFNFFEAFERSVTGATYRALPMGPVPQELEEALSKLGKNKIQITKKQTGLPNDTVVFRLADPTENDFGIFDANEKKVLDKVMTDYGRLSGKDLENITHAEAPYNAVVQGEQIPYELAFYRGKSREELVG